MVYLFLLVIPIVGLLVIRAFYRDFAGLGEWLWFQDEYDAIQGAEVGRQRLVS